MLTKTLIREWRERHCEGGREGQEPRQCGNVKGVKGKSSPAYTYTSHATATTPNTHASTRVCTRALHAFHPLHKAVVVRVSDVKPKFFPIHALHMPRHESQTQNFIGGEPKETIFIEAMSDTAQIPARVCTRRGRGADSFLSVKKQLARTKKEQHHG